MNPDFRQRVFLPVVMPLGVTAAFLAYAYALSRVLLAVPAFTATMLALLVAGYILLIASLVSAKERITSRALTVGVTLGIVALLAAGFIAANAGMRDLHAEEEVAAGEGEGAAPAVPPGTFVAIDISYEAAPESLPAGTTEITLVNDGQAEHNVTIEGVNGDEPILEAAASETETDSVELEAGTYTYYCSVPGHRSTMEGELTVE